MLLALKRPQRMAMLSLGGFCTVAEAHDPDALVVVLLGTLLVQLTGLAIQIVLIKLNRRAGIGAFIEVAVLCLSWLAWLTSAPVLFYASFFSSNFRGSEVLVSLSLAVTQTLAIYALRKLTKVGESEPMVEARAPLLMTGCSLAFFIVVVSVGLARHT